MRTKESCAACCTATGETRCCSVAAGDGHSHSLAWLCLVGGAWSEELGWRGLVGGLGRRSFVGEAFGGPRRKCWLFLV